MQNLDNLTTYNSTSQFWNVTRTLWYVVDAVDVAYSNNTDYDTNNTILLPPNESLFPWWQRIIWTILFAGIIIVATSGNLIVIWIVLAHRQMRTITNYFLVNLSIADAMMSSMNVSFGYIYMFDFEWLFAGTFYCKISEFIAVLTIFVSVFTLMAISIDRYMAIIYPLKPRRGKKMTLCVAIVIWIIGIILSLPMLFYRSSDAVKFRNGVRNVCSSIWPGKTNNEHSYYENLYNVMSMILTYFLPIIFMTCTYTRVGLNLWGSQSIGEATAQQLEKIQSKRKVVKMMIVVVVMFTVCWLPIHTFFIAYYYLPEIKTKPYVYELYLIAYWLAMSNSMYNPIIYCWMNKYFKTESPTLLCASQLPPWLRQVLLLEFLWVAEPCLSLLEVVTSRYSCTGHVQQNIAEWHGANTAAPAISERRKRPVVGSSSRLWQKMKDLADQRTCPRRKRKTRSNNECAPGYENIWI